MTPAKKKEPAKKKTTAKKKPAAKKTASKSKDATAAKAKIDKKAAPAKKEKKAIEENIEESVVQKTEKKGKKEEAKVPSIRIRLSAFDHIVLDEATAKIIETAERSGAVIHGPIPLPTKIRKFTVNKSTFVHKDSRDQYEMRTHRRLIDLEETTFKTIEALQSLSLPSGVDIEIKMG